MEKEKGGSRVIGVIVMTTLIVLCGAGLVFLKIENSLPALGTSDGESTVPDADMAERNRSKKTWTVKIGMDDYEIRRDYAVPEEDLKEGTDIKPVYREEQETGIHTYELIIADVTWMEAYQDCLARGGYLVRINSDEEYQAIIKQIEDEGQRKIKFWLGGTRGLADTYEYRWIYEDGAYGNEVLNGDGKYSSYWLDGEPSFYDGAVSQAELYVNMFYFSKEGRWVWNDVPNDLVAAVELYAETVGYICEYEDEMISD